jgi:hypothetical protein
MQYIKFISSIGDFKINLTECFKNTQILTEELSKADISNIEKLIDAKFKKADVESRIRDIVVKELDGKGNEKRVTEIVSNCMVQLYKQFWMKRTFWQSGIVNKPN